MHSDAFSHKTNCSYLVTLMLILNTSSLSPPLPSSFDLSLAAVIRPLLCHRQSTSSFPPSFDLFTANTSCPLSFFFIRSHYLNYSHLLLTISFCFNYHGGSKICRYHPLSFLGTFFDNILAFYFIPLHASFHAGLVPLNTTSMVSYCRVLFKIHASTLGICNLILSSSCNNSSEAFLL